LWPPTSGCARDGRRGPARRFARATAGWATRAVAPASGRDREKQSGRRDSRWRPWPLEPILGGSWIQDEG